MKISTLLETPTTSIGPNDTQAPRFGRSDKVLERGNTSEKVEEMSTTSGAIGSVATPMPGMQRRGKGSMFSGIKTSKKFPNSVAEAKWDPITGGDYSIDADDSGTNSPEKDKFKAMLNYYADSALVSRALGELYKETHGTGYYASGVGAPVKYLATLEMAPINKWSEPTRTTKYFANKQEAYKYAASRVLPATRVVSLEKIDTGSDDSDLITLPVMLGVGDHKKKWMLQFPDERYAQRWEHYYSNVATIMWPAGHELEREVEPEKVKAEPEKDEEPGKHGYDTETGKPLKQGQQSSRPQSSQYQPRPQKPQAPQKPSKYNTDDATDVEVKPGKKPAGIGYTKPVDEGMDSTGYTPKVGDEVTWRHSDPMSKMMPLPGTVLAVAPGKVKLKIYSKRMIQDSGKDTIVLDLNNYTVTPKQGMTMPSNVSSIGKQPHGQNRDVWVAKVEKQFPTAQIALSRSPNGPAKATLNGKVVAKFPEAEGVAEGSDTAPETVGKFLYNTITKSLNDINIPYQQGTDEYNRFVQSYKKAMADQDRKYLRLGMEPEKLAKYLGIQDGAKWIRKAQGVAEGLSKRDQQDMAAIQAAIARLEAQLKQPNADQDAIQQSIAHEKKRLALYGQGVTEGDDMVLDEKSKSKAQFRMMAAVANNPKFAKKVGISQKVGKEFHGADKGANYKSLPKKVDEAEISEEQILAKKLQKQLDMFKKGPDHDLGNKPKNRDIGNKPSDREVQKKKMSEATKEADYGPDYQDMVKRVGEKAKQGPMKTVWDEKTRKYKVVPVNAPTNK